MVILMYFISNPGPYSKGLTLGSKKTKSQFPTFYTRKISWFESLYICNIVRYIASLSRCKRL